MRGGFESGAGPVLIVAGVLLAACGGEDLGRPSDDPLEPLEKVDPCLSTEGYEFQTIVDFETTEADGTLGPLGTRRPAACDPGTTCSKFYLNTDTDLTHPGETTDLHPICPADAQASKSQSGNQNGLRTNAIPDGRCDESTAGFHFVGKDIATCVSGATGRRGWGGSFEIQFSPSFDASGWDGVSFWVRKGEEPSGATLILTVADPYTDGHEYMDPVTGVTRKCDMTASTTIPDSEKCDAFGVAVTLTSEWAFVAARFEDLHQKGFGLPSPLGHLKSSEIAKMQYLFVAGDWDFWIDDLAFFRVR